VKPYYQHAGITIYHGDCREILPNIKCDCVVTDPPYGIGYKPTWKKWNGSDSAWTAIIGDDISFDPSHLLTFRRLALWGANYYSWSLPIGSWMCWDKRCSASLDAMAGSSFELAWLRSVDKALPLTTMVRILHGGVVNADSADGNNDARYHPTQKPVKLMEKCIVALNEKELVADPYMGSGSTLLAAKNLGLSAIGIEIEEKYCEIAAKRLSQEVLEFK